MCTKKTLSIFEKLFLFSTHYIYEKNQYHVGILGIIVIVLLREKKNEWVDSLSSV